MNFLSAITAKKLGKPLDTQQIEYFSRAAAEGLVPDYQLAAMLMAIRLNGMDWPWRAPETCLTPTWAACP